MEIIGWLIAMVMLILIEICTLGLTTIWFAGGSLVALVASLVGANFAIQVILFFVVSFVMLFFTRPIAMKHFNNQREKTNVDSLIGNEGRVKVAIDNFAGEGMVILHGQEWTARSVDGERIPDGCSVIVKEIQGVKLMVAKKAE